jgi:CO/xanthine dehydrogenase Mo-binding subunit
MVSRRAFIEAATLASGGLLIGCTSLEPGAAVVPAAAPAAVPTGPAVFNLYLQITPDGLIRIVTPQSEMGQGIHDGLPRILADELDAAWGDVRVRMPWADDGFINATTKRHRTANSESTMVYFEPLRRLGAAAREMLVAAAAARWGVDAAACRTAASRVHHDPSGRSASYGELAAAAAALAPPPAPRLKTRDQWTLIGRELPRTDTPPKTDGSLQFGIDVRLPGMLYAALRRSPAVVSRVVGFDRDAALALPGVVDAFEVPEGIAVVANSTWQALRAAEQLQVEFDTSAAESADSATIAASMQTALDDDAAAKPGRPAFGLPPYSRDATLAALAAAPRRHEWTYEVPFLAHAALEPLCATVLVTDDRCEAWAPTQQPDRARDELARISGLPREQCRLNINFLGGGFGRKWEIDYVRQAAQIAARVRGRPVKLTWTREQDFRHDRFRPAHRVRTRVGLGKDGRILAMHSRTTGISMWKYQQRPPTGPFGDFFSTGLLINDRYDFANKYVDVVDTDFPIPVGTWRSVSQSMNTFFSESAIDDIAAVTRQDPIALRLSLMGNDPRGQAVLRLLAEKSGWGSPLPKGRGRGVAYGIGYGSFCAQVVEVTVRGKSVHIDRIVCVFDCGTMVDPRAVEAQVSGGIVWGLSAARDGRISFDRGAARESNFHDAPIIRLNETPPIEVHLVRNEHSPGGCGEASVPPVAPALASAIHAATGQRPRVLPLVEAGYEFV